MYLRIQCLIGLLCVCSSANAERVSEASYAYLYTDPYLATTTVGILKDRDHDWVHDENRYLRLELIGGRNDNIPLLEGKGTLRVRYTPTAGPAPLVFVVPGFGGSAYTGSTRYVAQLLSDHGFQVLALPSPFNWNFTLAASGSGFPGVIRPDSEDLYRAMQVALAYIRRHYCAEITGTGLLGLSHGALYAANVSRLDARQKKISFDRILLVNPPVDLLRAVRTIDRLAGLKKRYTEKERDDIEAYAAGVAWQALHRSIDDPGYFAHWDQRLRLDDEQIGYPIGETLRRPLGDSLYAMSLVHPLEVLNAPISWGYRSAREEQAQSFTLFGYLNHILLPWIHRANGRDLSLEALAREGSLKHIAPALRDNSKVFLMHNADDFLLSRDDLKLVEETFRVLMALSRSGRDFGF